MPSSKVATTRRRVLPAVILLLSALLLAGAALLAGPFGPAPVPGAIRNSLLGAAVGPDERWVRYQPAGQAAPIPHVPVPAHPFMAAHGGNNMHNDAYMTDTDEAPGPRGLGLQVHSRTQGFGGYGTIAFDRTGRLVGVYSNGRRFQLELMDPVTLRELAAYDLPPRPAGFFLQGTMPWEYIGAGTYFYLDHLDRAVVPTTHNTVLVVQVPDMRQRTTFELVREYDLSEHALDLPWPRQDSVAWVLPDWDGEFYWFATTAGVIGTLHAASGSVHTLRLAGEIVENSFAVDAGGVYIASDRALYRFSHEPSGAILTDWRTAYDRGPRKKPGLITRGTGASVTLLGDAGDLAAITDNAEPQIHLLFVRRADGRVVCSVPLFEPGKSATDITVVGVEQPGGVYSAIAENNWARHVFPFPQPQPGITRVDAVRGQGGSYRCAPVWASAERNLGVFKLSLGSGLLYLYGGEGTPLDSRWYLAALDFDTGHTVYKQLAGTGLGYDNWAGALFIHPAGGAVYSTTIFGLVALRDSAALEQP